MIQIDHHKKCPACQAMHVGKECQTGKPRLNQDATSSLAKVISDQIISSISLMPLEAYNYGALFTDDTTCQRFLWTYGLKTKERALTNGKLWKEQNPVKKIPCCWSLWWGISKEITNWKACRNFTLIGLENCAVQLLPPIIQGRTPASGGRISKIVNDAGLVLFGRKDSPDQIASVP